METDLGESDIGQPNMGESKINLPHPCWCLILSGPEPQRSMLFEKVTEASPASLLPSSAGALRPDAGKITVISLALLTFTISLLSLTQATSLVPLTLEISLSSLTLTPPL